MPVFSGTPYVPLTSADWDDRFSKALLVSAIVHIVLIFGLHFKAANPKLFDNSMPPLDVVLVNAKSREAPLNAELLAQHNLAGGGTVEENRQAASPLPVSRHDQEQSAEAEMHARMQALEAKTQAMMRQLQSSYKVPEPTPNPQAEARPVTPVPAPQDLTQRSIEMARLQAKIEQDYSEYQKRPRRLEVGANAREFNLAQYLEAWRIKVERVGNLNYPEIARRNHLYGNLLLSVCIKDDGTLEQVEVMRSSGIKILDAAAQHIVNMAAPFGRFPPALRKEADILCITRTWTFTRSDELATSP
jgi:protein TonB